MLRIWLPVLPRTLLHSFLILHYGYDDNNWWCLPAVHLTKAHKKASTTLTLKCAIFPYENFAPYPTWSNMSSPLFSTQPSRAWQIQSDGWADIVLKTVTTTGVRQWHRNVTLPAFWRSTVLIARWDQKFNIMIELASGDCGLHFNYVIYYKEQCWKGV